MSEFDYYNSPETTFTVLKHGPDSPIFNPDANTVTYHGYFEVENLTKQAVDDVYVTLPYIWARVTDESNEALGDPGYVALDFQGGAWTAKDFNGIEGLNLKVTAEIVPLDHPYTTGSIAAGSIASDASLTDVFGPSSTDELPEAPYPPETLDGNDRIPSVNLGELEAREDVALDLEFTYNWTLDGNEVDYNALRTAGYVVTLDPVEDSLPTAGAVDALWLV